MNTLESELALHKVAEPQSAKAIVFLHGVNGDWRKTWTNSATRLFWPDALGRSTGWGTYSVEYDANTNWGRATMPLQERAVSIAELLRDASQLAEKEIAIVAHSFGGVVAKQMYRYIHDRDRYHDLKQRLAGIVFLGTPHSGADIATYGHYLRWALGSTVTLEDLRAHSPLLTELSDWYRNADSPPAHVLYETRRMHLGWFRRWLMIVDRASANPGIAGVAVVPVDADHAEISRPATTNSVQFSSTKTFLDQVFAIPAWLARYPRQVAAVCYREGTSGVEFLLVRTTGGRWTFPKGGIESQRGLAGSAAQEALEEAGVTGAIHPEPIAHYLHAKRELKDSDERAARFCVSAFPLKVVNERARAPERNRSPTWFSPNEAKLRLSEDRPGFYQQEFERVIDEAMRHIAQR